jgi:uncharacterized RDD family membrane protein YckC
MDQNNPYQPPTTAEALPEQASGDLATRLARFGAAMIDGLILIALLIPAQIAFGVYDGFPQVTPQGYLATLGWATASTLVWIAINGATISRSAQTIGKKLLGIKVVTLTGENASFNKIVVWRMLPIALGGALVPVVGNFVGILDALFIFRSDRRCIHDLIAATRVVRA